MGARLGCFSEFVELFAHLWDAIEEVKGDGDSEQGENEVRPDEKHIIGK
jgi:hypothetical protein